MAAPVYPTPAEEREHSQELIDSIATRDAATLTDLLGQLEAPVESISQDYLTEGVRKELESKFFFNEETAKFTTSEVEVLGSSIAGGDSGSGS